MARFESLARVLAPALIVLAGCSTQSPEPTPVNQPPTVQITMGPPQGDPVSSYRVHVTWTGNDPDGQIVRYETLMTNDELTGPLIIDEELYARLEAMGYTWTSTVASQADYVVAADQPPDLEVPADSIYVYGDDWLFHAQHTFFLRAVDDDGAVTPVPASRSFTATTLAPEVRITRPADTDEVGGWEDYSQVTRFEWDGSDLAAPGDTETATPDSSRFALFAAADLPGLENSGVLLALPDSGWSPWRAWNDDDDALAVGGRHALLGPLTPYTGGEVGRYCLFVQAKDEAGAVTSHFRDGVGLRRFRARVDMAPRLHFSEPTFGSRTFYEVENIWDLSVFEGLALELEWTGDASYYGGEVRDYRYGWNLTDTDDDASWTHWAQDYTSISATLNVGDQSLYVQCRDLAGNICQVRIAIHVVPFTLDQDLAFVDDYDNTPTSNPIYGWPDGGSFTWGNYTHTDADMEAWWMATLAPYAGYVPARDFYRTSPTASLPMELLGSYRRILWEVKEPGPGESGLASVAGFRDPYSYGPNAPADYVSLWIAQGGQLLLCGSQPVRALLPTVFDMSNADYERKLPMVLDRGLELGYGSQQESLDAIGRFLPRRWLGVESVTLPVDATPRDLGTPTAYDFATRRTHWGMVGARLTGRSVDVYGNANAWTPPDTLRFKPEVYAWFAAAGPLFNNPADGCPGATFFGLNDAEIYNWEWLTAAMDPPFLYDPEGYLPLLSYVPADPETRWGETPNDALCLIGEQDQPRDETAYTLGSYREHWVGLVGGERPERPSVVLGFSPFFLDPNDGRGLLGHILTDIMDLPR
ncbi:hypothetical protein KDL67_06515 [bacterium]|nr:hypothetical protein [bacterium]